MFVALIVRKIINFDLEPVSITNYIKYLAMGTGNEVAFPQRWANLDQASKHLEVFRFRDLSPTPIP
jgi:hypothetical protein